MLKVRVFEMIIEVVLLGLKPIKQVFAKVEKKDRSRLRRTAASLGVSRIMYKLVFCMKIMQFLKLKKKTLICLNSVLTELNNGKWNIRFAHCC